MTRWLVLLIIGLMVISCASGCVLVVADENVAHEIQAEKDRSRMARSISKDLDRDESLQYSDIKVSEMDGVVTLRGDVDSVDSLQYVIDRVASYTGVEKVVSHLTVEVEL